VPTPENILIDLNVILDVLLERAGFEHARDVLKLGEAGTQNLYISAHIVTTFAYLLENAKVPKSQILRHVHWMLETFTVVAVDKALLKSALASGLSDFEDAVIEGTAVACNASKIITANIKDFKNSAVNAMTPTSYLNQFES
jgi:predicted nucleic-acid-binding protein